MNNTAAIRSEDKIKPGLFLKPNSACFFEKITLKICKNFKTIPPGTRLAP